MEDKPVWLPNLVLLEEAGGNWDTYLDLIYRHFCEDFVNDKPSFEGRRLGLKKYPMTHGKEATFWHFIQEGPVEEDRVPDPRRCERIRWPRPIIEHAKDPNVKVWGNRRRNETRICLWLENQEYLVILADRGEYILPWTAYPVVHPHRKRKLQKEFEQYWKSEKP